jgi:RNA-directed DNA polymerase
MSPTQQLKDLLFKQATSRYVLNAAWVHVKPRLEKSKDEKIRADAASFASNVQRCVSQLQQSLRDSTFRFERQKGILKKRKAEAGQPAKDPRPIVVAPAKNRIVQRALLDVCQSDDKAIRRRLGKLTDVIGRPTSVGGLPGRGVPEAIELIKGAMATGATWYVRSDLQNFFQAVPKDLVRKFLDANVTGPKFNDLFMEALTTELSNEDEVRDLMRLFPTGAVGVPQGSALSALCANIVLSEFDVEFNQRGIVTIRYLDDFVMLGKGKSATEIAFKVGEKLLDGIGFKCHDPFTGRSGKASAGPVSEGFEFLSFRISPNKIVPTRAACADFVADVKLEIGSAKTEIRGGLDVRRTQPRYVQTLALLDQKIRGWGDAFRPTTDRLIFDQLDDKLGIEIEDFRSWFEKHSKHLGKRQFRRAQGIALLFDTPAHGATSQSS